MSRDDVSEFQIPPHFTNIQHGLQMARQLLACSGHAEPPDHPDHRRLADRTFRRFVAVSAVPAGPADRSRRRCAKAQLCQREGITINIFLVPSWSQSEEDIRFAYRLAESTGVACSSRPGRDLDRYVVWDYVHRKREILA